tara:strand:- start:214 stop:411 length:198 start_codon:yes stop_codon:yes gene_type:complete
MNDIDREEIQRIELSIIDKFKDKINEAGYGHSLKWDLSCMLWDCIHKVGAEKSEYWKEKLKELNK